MRRNKSRGVSQPEGYDVTNSAGELLANLHSNVSSFPIYTCANTVR